MNNKIIYKTDNDGEKIIVVPLQNSHLTVKLFENDYKELDSLGVGLPWKLVQGQIVVRNNKLNLSVARLIVDAGEGVRVDYEDGDSTNLRRSNLIKTLGNGLHRTRDKLEIDPVYARFKRRLGTPEYVVVRQ